MRVPLLQYWIYGKWERSRTADPSPSQRSGNNDKNGRRVLLREVVDDDVVVKCCWHGYSWRLVVLPAPSWCVSNQLQVAEGYFPYWIKLNYFEPDEDFTLLCLHKPFIHIFTAMFVKLVERIWFQFCQSLCRGMISFSSIVKPPVHFIHVRPSIYRMYTCNSPPVVA